MIQGIDFEHLEFYHSTPIQVRFSDIDMMNHVNNSIQTTYCDVARVAYFEEVFQLMIGRTEESLIVAALDVNFKLPIFVNEQVLLQNKIVEIGHKSMKMAQQIIDMKSGQVKTQIVTILAGYNHLELHGIAIPERWKTQIEKFEGCVKFKYPV